MADCCSDPAHPYDIGCWWGLNRRKKCAGAPPSVTMSGTSPEPNPQEPPEKLKRLLTELAELGNNLPPGKILNAATALYEAGFPQTAINAVCYLEHITPSNNFKVMSKSFAIKALAFGKLGKVDAAMAAFAVSEHLANIAKLTKNMGVK